jgi:hypothetical protein
LSTETPEGNKFVKGLPPTRFADALDITFLAVNKATKIKALHLLAERHRTLVATGLALAVQARRLVTAESGLSAKHDLITYDQGEDIMIGAEIVIGVIIGVLFELWSNTEGTPLENLAVKSVAK